MFGSLIEDEEDFWKSLDVFDKLLILVDFENVVDEDIWVFLNGGYMNSDFFNDCFDCRVIFLLVSEDLRCILVSVIFGFV